MNVRACLLVTGPTGLDSSKAYKVCSEDKDDCGEGTWDEESR